MNFINTKDMDLQLSKIELIEMLLKTKKESVLIKIKEILEQDNDRLSEEDYQFIDNRRQRYIEGESKSFTWEVSKKSILES